MWVFLYTLSKIKKRTGWSRARGKMPEGLWEQISTACSSFDLVVVSLHNLRSLSSSGRVNFQPQFPLPVQTQVTWVQSFLSSEQDSRPSSFFANLLGLAAGGCSGVLSLFNTTQGHLEKSKRCFICSSVSISGLGRE